MNIIIEMIGALIFGVIGMLLITGLIFGVFLLSIIIWGVILAWLPSVRSFLSDYLKLSNDDINFLPFFALVVIGFLNIIF